MEETQGTIYVMGYPKSGNTWIARMIADLTGGRIAADDPVNAALIGNAGKGSVLIHKRHDTRESAPDEVKRAHAVVYIIRDFRDVIISWYFFAFPRMKEDWIAKGCRFYMLPMRLHFVLNARLQIACWGGSMVSRMKQRLSRRKGTQTVGGWSSHVKSWIDAPGVMLIRYEDLLADCPREMRRIAEGLGLTVSAGTIDEVAGRHAFANVKTLFEGRGDDVNAKFLRSGRSGNWMRFLDRHLLAVIRREHGDVMARMGYELTRQAGNEGCARKGYE